MRFRIEQVGVSLRKKCQNTEIFLVRVFSYSGWIRKFTDYFDAFHAVYARISKTEI